jgi:hypothetical protein
LIWEWFNSATFYEVSVPSQETERSCICMLGVSILPLSTIKVFEFETYFFLISFQSFFFWPLCCLFFFNLWILIPPLVSSNSSCHSLTQRTQPVLKHYKYGKGRIGRSTFQNRFNCNGDEEKLSDCVSETTYSCSGEIVAIQCSFSVLCCVFCALFVFVLCLVQKILSMSLNCPFLIAPSVLSIFY